MFSLFVHRVHGVTLEKQYPRRADALIDMHLLAADLRRQGFQSHSRVPGVLRLAKPDAKLVLFVKPTGDGAA